MSYTSQRKIFILTVLGLLLILSTLSIYNFDDIQSYSLSLKESQETVKKPRKLAFISFLEYPGPYIKGTLVLGHTLKKYSGFYKKDQNEPQMILLTLQDFPSELKVQLESVGWELKVVNPIQPFKPVTIDKFKNQYTKLLMWNMTEYDAIVYIDSDCYVKGSLNDLFDAVLETNSWDFAAVGDAWDDYLDLKFNAGVLVFRPSRIIFEDMMLNGKYYDYNGEYAEQAFLNSYYEHRFLRLPYIYNMNVVLYSHHRKIWDKLWENTRIVHMTLCKSFTMDCTVDYKQMDDFWKKEYNEMMNRD